MDLGPAPRSFVVMQKFFNLFRVMFPQRRLGKMIIANHRVIRSHTWKVFQLEADTYYYDGLGQVTAKTVSMTQTDH